MDTKHTFKELVKMGHTVLGNNQFKNGLNVISDYLTDITGAERCSIFIYDDSKDELWTILATGIGKIHVPSEKGIVGYVFRTEDSIIENNVANNIHFLSDIDKHSGYITVNIIACPIYNTKKKLIGVLELLNKPGGFSEHNLDYLNIYAGYIGSLIELAPFYFQEEPT